VGEGRVPVIPLLEYVGTALGIPAVPPPAVLHWSILTFLQI
jgi:hypothetical protein